jgi:hypothetical protein
MSYDIKFSMHFLGTHVLVPLNVAGIHDIHPSTCDNSAHGHILAKSMDDKMRLVD